MTSLVKEDLRREIRRLKQCYAPEQLEALSQSVIARLRPWLADARVVLAYYSLPDEVCTHQLIDDLVAEGKVILLPKVIDQAAMELRRYAGPYDLVEGAFGIMEPIGEPFTDYSLIDVALIPGIAFDAQGHRLGRGRGYYDRFLNSMEARPQLLGLCFDFQKVAFVPFDAYDIPVDAVV